MKLTTEQCSQIAQAIYTVNRHVKTALDKKPLYQLKKDALLQLVQQGYAKKIGLHFSDNPTRSQQSSSTLIEFQNYCFHLPITAEDKHLPHLGQLDQRYANPPAKMSLFQAKQLLTDYTQSISKSKKTPASKTPIYSGLSYTPSPSEYRRQQQNPHKKK